MKNTKSFTLVELIIVAIIVGLLGFVAIPSMLKTVQRSYAKDAMNNLIAIYAAQKDYKQTHNSYLMPCDLACINRSLDTGGLGLNIVASGGNTNYLCDSVSSYSVCYVTNGSVPANGFQAVVRLERDLNTINPLYGNVQDYSSSILNPWCFNYAANPKVPGSACP